MRVVKVDANSRIRSPFRWTLPRVLVLVAVFAAPFVLLISRLHAEGGNELNTPPATVNAYLLTRFVVVGLFAVLLTKWCVDWMRGRRR